MGRGRDAIYTPSSVARQLAEALPEGLKGNVLDPAAGEGALLAAVSERFGGSVRSLAIDIDSTAVAALSKKVGWTVSRADTLSPKSRRSSVVWRAARDELAAVVVNPPFSYRGNGGEIVELGGFRGRVAPAIEFLHALVTELEPASGFWAILPEGAVFADKHKAFWQALRQERTVEVMAEFHQKTFPGARVSTWLVHVSPRTNVTSGPTLPSPTSLESASSPTACVCVEVIRGRIPVHRIAEVGPHEVIRFLHTTDIGVNASAAAMRSAPAIWADEAPFVVIARVGQWCIPTVIEVGRVVLSDCVIALRPRIRSSLERLTESITNAEADFLEQYKGTGAKYMTLESVCGVLKRRGWDPVITRAGQIVQDCSCGAMSAFETSPANIAEHQAGS